MNSLTCLIELLCIKNRSLFYRSRRRWGGISRIWWLNSIASGRITWRSAAASCWPRWCWCRWARGNGRPSCWPASRPSTRRRCWCVRRSGAASTTSGATPKLSVSRTRSTVNTRARCTRPVGRRRRTAGPRAAAPPAPASSTSGASSTPKSRETLFRITLFMEYNYPFRCLFDVFENFAFSSCLRGKVVNTVYRST